MSISVSPVLSELKIVIEELFAVMSVKCLVESDRVLGIANFVKDFLKNVYIWDVNSNAGKKVLSVKYKVLHYKTEELKEVSGSSDESSDIFF